MIFPEVQIYFFSCWRLEIEALTLLVYLMLWLLISSSFSSTQPWARLSVHFCSSPNQIGDAHFCYCRREVTPLNAIFSFSWNISILNKLFSQRWKSYTYETKVLFLFLCLLDLFEAIDNICTLQSWKLLFLQFHSHCIQLGFTFPIYFFLKSGCRT